MNQLFFLLFLAALYFPMLGRALPPFQQRQETFLNYGLPAVALVTIVAVIANILADGESRKTKDPLFWPMIFLGAYALLWAVKGVMVDINDLSTLTMVRTKVAGPVYGLCCAAILYSMKDRLRYSSFIPLMLALVFGAQTYLSAIESIRGVGFGKYEFGYIGDQSVEARDMLQALGIFNLGLFGFKIPFSGQIGQHNGFGNQLVFYLFVFLGLLIGRRHRWIAWFLAGLVVFDLLVNTTRISLFCAVVTILMILPLELSRKQIVRLFAVLGIVMASLVFLYFYLGRLAEMTARVDSFTSRTILWDLLLSDTFERMDLWTFLFGFGPVSITSLGVFFRDAIVGSTENQFIAVFLESGALGCGAFLWIFICTPLKEALLARGEPLVQRMGLAFAFSIFACGLTMDLHMHFTSMPLILIAYDQLLHHSRACRQPRPVPTSFGTRPQSALRFVPNRIPPPSIVR